MTQVITKTLLSEAYTYAAYREMIDRLFAEGKTTGENHDEKMIHYTKMNIRRMKRLDKTIKIDADFSECLQKIDRPQVWLAITEAWCGDAAQNLPVIQKIAEQNPKISLKFILRDEHPQVMDRYLTNGARSIPKVVLLDADSLEEIAVWGSRPGQAQKMVETQKASGTPPAVYVENLHKWYTENKGKDLQKEWCQILLESGVKCECVL